MEWLRSLVRTKGWDYCVVWKVKDDSKRFIEWKGCCCGGADQATQEDEDDHLFKPCRDLGFQHLRRTKPCEAIAKLPTSICLSSGVYAQVLRSGKPRWSFNNASKFNSNDEKIGTKVLIPLLDYLIELFVAKHVPKDQQIIDFVLAHNISFEIEAIKLNTPTYDNRNLVENPPQGFISLCHPTNYLDEISSNHYHSVMTQHNFGHFYEGSAMGIVPLDDPCVVGHSLGITDSFVFRQERGLDSKCGDLMEDDELNLSKRSEPIQHKSKNLVAERKRRLKLKDRIYNLRALVPKITKMDVLSTLGDSISFIKELQKKEKDLQDELKDMEEEDNFNNYLNLGTNEKIEIEDHEVRQLSPSEFIQESKHNQDLLIDMKQDMELQVELKQLGVKEFYLKFFWEQRRDGFIRLLEAMNSLGLKVMNVNVTTFKGMVLNILTLEAENEEVRIQEVKDLLLHLARSDG